MKSESEINVERKGLKKMFKELLESKDFKIALGAAVQETTESHVKKFIKLAKIMGFIIIPLIASLGWFIQKEYSNHADNLISLQQSTEFLKESTTQLTEYTKGITRLMESIEENTRENRKDITELYRNNNYRNN